MRDVSFKIIAWNEGLMRLAFEVSTLLICITLLSLVLIVNQTEAGGTMLHSANEFRNEASMHWPKQQFS